MDSQIIEVLNVTRETAWLPWAVQYFFLIGLSYGSFMLTLPYFVFGRAQYEKLGRLALLGALACGLTAPVALLADLHGPGRFLNFYLHFQPQSWMSWGSFFIPVYLVGLLLYAWLALRGDFAVQGQGGDSLLTRLYRLAGRGGVAPRMAISAAALLTLVGAVLVALYTGMEVMVVHARPLWNTAFLPLQFAATAFAGAIGLALLFNRFVGDHDTQLEIGLNRLLVLALAVVLTLGGGWLFVSLSGVSPSHSAAFSQVAGMPQWQLTAVWAVLATILPMALAIWRPASSGLITGLIAVHSAWMMRWTIFIGGQSIPKTGAGLYDYHLPLGGDGLLGIVGTLGLWIALLVLMVDYLPWAGQAFASRNKKETNALATSAIAQH
ncbi:tetrathionate reductase [Sulfuricella sp. T08]|uniref:NrfD/PsrC family molybdoenzyme membrane anchor subunit n=1 Tax=Sulfuricella sp. T08 TaxID=1632857 RepID=UPI000617A169|nr:NrfD/PsrC family molybdoenzyme membrane anchor subunit [Sulfuricella sp. T08]GAO35039.1 tetrathionate reductase [Sulfuricella sp. T08]